MAKTFIDKQAILESTDLYSLTGCDGLKRKSTKNGGEFTGPCPFCGGSDRFNVQPYHKPYGRWLCRNCTEGRWQDAISFVMMRDNCDFKTACSTLAGGDLPTTTEIKPAPPAPATQPTGGDWQNNAMRAIAICYENLRKPAGSVALAWLHGRGFTDKTIDYFRLGYSPVRGFYSGDMYIPHGIVIPCVSLDEVWYLKISYMPGDLVRCKGKKDIPDHKARAREVCPICGEVNKYTGVSNNRTAAIFNGDELLENASAVLFCEGEFDTMAAWQSVDNIMAVVGMPGAKTGLDLAAWGAHLMAIRRALIVYDNDGPGKDGAQKMLDLLGDRATRCQLPDGVKDINDFTLAGGDLYGWILPHLDRLGVLEDAKYGV